MKKLTLLFAALVVASSSVIIGCGEKTEGDAAAQPGAAATDGKGKTGKMDDAVAPK